MIILAEPLDQLLETLDIIGPDLNPGVHLFDVSGIKDKPSTSIWEKLHRIITTT